MKFLYIKQVIVIIGLLIAIVCPIKIFQAEYNAELTIRAEEINHYSKNYNGVDEITGMINSANGNLSENGERKIRNVKILAYVTSIISILIGIFIIKKSDKIVTKIIQK